MNREQIEARLAELRKEMEQLHANANAVSGAIQDCEYWLAQIDAEEKPKSDLPNVYVSE
jgi:hypothetical protein